MTAPKTPVEVAARGIHAGELRRGETIRTWDEVHEIARAAYVDEARDALTALAASPDVVERVIRALRRHVVYVDAGRGTIRCACSDTAWFESADEHRAHQARAALAALTEEAR